MLKDTIRSLHDGATIADAKRRFAEEIGSVDTGELVSIEHSLIEEGLTPEEITRFCNVHVELLQDSLTGGDGGGTEPPAVTRLKSENAVARGIVARTREVCRSLEDYRPLNEALSEVEDQILSLHPIVHHYSLKENIIFPHLEKYGFPDLRR